MQWTGKNSWSSDICGRDFLPGVNVTFSRRDLWKSFSDKAISWRFSILVLFCFALPWGNVFWRYFAHKEWGKQKMQSMVTFRVAEVQKLCRKPHDDPYLNLLQIAPMLQCFKCFEYIMAKSSFVSCGSAVSLWLKLCFTANTCFSLQRHWEPVSYLCKTTMKVLESISVGTECVPYEG